MKNIKTKRNNIANSIMKLIKKTLTHMINSIVNKIKNIFFSFSLKKKHTHYYGYHQ